MRVPSGLFAPARVHPPLRSAAIALFFVASVTTLPASSSSVDASGDWTLPVATWSGILVLPNANERRADGGVHFIVENAPDDARALIGNRVWLAFDERTPGLMERVARAVVDVRFTKEIHASAREGTVYPMRIDGWSRVSPLESLAASHPVDDVTVALAGVRVARSKNATVLLIDRAPVAIEGARVALVRFTSSTDAARGRVRVAHWNRATRDFTGRAETLAFAPKDALAQGGSPATSLVDIEHTPENDTGYFVYGRVEKERGFVIRAIAPYAHFSTVPTIERRGEDAQRFLAHESWQNLDDHPHGTWRVRLAKNDRTERDWQVGERALLVHIFGSTGGARGEPLKWRILSAGHFAYGIATVVVDPFTGQRRFDIVYNQLYGGNPEGILAGRTSWAAYMGSLARGVMYRRPVSDLLLRHPAFTQTLSLPGGTFDPLDELHAELDVMAARWRTGDGIGGVVIDPAQNCVQDASAAVFIAFRRFEREIANAPNMTALDVDDPTRQRVLALGALLHRVESRLVPLGGWRSDWKRAAQLAVVTDRGASAPLTWARAAVTMRTMLPRAAHDALGEIALDEGAEVWALRSNFLGGSIAGIRPLPPKSIARR
jgi:predicted Abi (CAAX) family protease